MAIGRQDRIPIDFLIPAGILVSIPLGVRNAGYDSSVEAISWPLPVLIATVVIAILALILAFPFQTYMRPAIEDTDFSTSDKSTIFIPLGLASFIVSQGIGIELTPILLSRSVSAVDGLISIAVEIGFDLVAGAAVLIIPWGLAVVLRLGKGLVSVLYYRTLSPVDAFVSLIE